VNVLFGPYQSAEHDVDVVLVIAQWAQWHCFVFNDDAALQRTLQQI
jgi:hypothetical protein